LHAIHRYRPALLLAAGCVVLLAGTGMRPADAQKATPRQKWVTTWAASAQGPYPIGNPSLQPEQKFAFPDPATGAEDQTFRMIVRPDVWGARARLRFSNVFGVAPLVLDNVYAGLHSYAGNIVRGTNRAVTFGSKSRATVPAGALQWSDPVDLKFSRNPEGFHVVGPSGPMTWHAKALQTSYVTAPRAGVHSRDESDAALPYSTASWFFLDAVDVMAPADTEVVVCFGDSITDGTASTLNGDDRWPDVLAARAHDRYGRQVVVVNAGIGGNRVVGPADYPQNPIPGGPGALDRLERDVLGLSGVTTVIWMEGINDYGATITGVETVISGYRQGISSLHAKGIKVIGATLTSALNSTITTHGTEEVDAKRKETNAFIRSGAAFDAFTDFDAATLDGATGEIQPQMQPNSTVGGAAGDKLHPNRAGYAAMANAIELALIAPRSAVHRRRGAN
jgi:lysophospholipase L1-like esterase